MWKQKAIEALKSANLKLTPQRLKLIEIIAEIGNRHPTLAEILEKVREEFPTTSFSTLYTNILMLKALGLLEIFAIGDETRIELNLKPHINVFDREIRDFCDDELMRKIEEKIGMKVKIVLVFVDKEIKPPISF
ncbi:MAG: transcriptional repressor [Archaeoglobaceae archaeon]|nr:transcriptional repressor [Archaeoglobales archaeon]